MYAMTSIAIHGRDFHGRPSCACCPEKGSATHRVDASRPTLRLLDTASAPSSTQCLSPAVTAPPARPCSQTSPSTMPPSTVFEQAGAIWEVLVRAPDSSLVILAGELEEIDGQSLMGMLVHRSPEVPVVCLDAAEPYALERLAPRSALRTVAL